MRKYYALAILWAASPFIFLFVIACGFGDWMREIRQIWWNVPFHWRNLLDLSAEIRAPGSTLRKRLERRMPRPACASESNTVFDRSAKDEHPLHGADGRLAGKTDGAGSAP